LYRYNSGVMLVLPDAYDNFDVEGVARGSAWTMSPRTQSKRGNAKRSRTRRSADGTREAGDGQRFVVGALYSSQIQLTHSA
jgi:hypothetical protein